MAASLHLEQAASPGRSLTFLFADAENFTQLFESLGDEAAAECSHHFLQVISEAGQRHAGAEVNRVGDSVFLLFQSADDALTCAREIQSRLESQPYGPTLRCRIGMHTGPAVYQAGTVFGRAVNKAARIASLAAGGQILLSEEAYRDLTDTHGHEVVWHTEVPLRGFQGNHTLYRYGALDARRSYEPNEERNAFVGREALLAEVNVALVAGPLVALIGPSGMGKSRLAREVLQRLLHAGRVLAGCTVDLGGCLDDPDAFESALQVQAGKCLSGPDLSLVVLDSFEAVIDNRTRLPELIAERPWLRFLVTSTDPLGVGEQAITVPPLGYAPGDEPGAGETESLALFRQRAREAGVEWEQETSDREAAARICTLLEGVPLAIELAVGLVPGTRLALLESELRNTPLQLLHTEKPLLTQLHHAGLRNALAYSFNRLEAPYRRALLRCSVLTADFDTAAVSALCGSPAEKLLQELACRGLLQTSTREGEARYSMLDVVREFSQEQLGTLRPRYEESAAAYYLEFAAYQNRRLLTEEQAPAFRLLQGEIRNLRAGMDWAMRNGRDEWISQYAVNIWPMLLYHGLLRECEERLRAGIAAALRLGDRRLACSLTCRLAGPLGELGRTHDLRQACLEGLELAREVEAPALEAHSLLGLAAVADELGNTEEARHHYAESLRLYEQLEDGWGRGQAYEQIARSLDRRGEWAAAAAACDQALEVVRVRKDRWSEQRLLAQRGQLSLRLGNREEAEALLGASVSQAETMGYHAQHLTDMLALARIAREGEHEEKARWAIGCCLSVAHQLAVDPPLGFEYEAGLLALRDGNRLTAQAYFTEGTLRAWRAGSAAQAAECLEALLEAMEPEDRTAIAEHAALLLPALLRGELPSETEFERVLHR